MCATFQFLPADITHGTCCLKFNTQHVLFCFSTLRLLCQNSMRRVLSPTFKQHRPCVETTSRQDNTHYVPQATHQCAESTSSHVLGVLYCPSCIKITHEMRYKCCFNTRSNNTRWGHSCGLFQHGCFFCSAPHIQQ